MKLISSVMEKTEENKIHIIYKILWPRELINTIDSLSENHRLNMESLSFLKKYTRNSLIFFILLDMFFVFSFPIFFIFVLSVIPILFRHDLKSIYRQQLQAYITGEKVYAIVEKFEVYYQGRQKIVCKLKQNEDISVVINLGAGPRLLEKDHLDKGDEIEVFYNPNYPWHTMPNISYLNKVFSLDKDKLD